MGDRRKQTLGVQFDGKLELGFLGATMTSDAGRPPSRERDGAFRLSGVSSTTLPDPRRGKNTQHAHSGYFEYACYHPLFLFNQYGDLEEYVRPPNGRDGRTRELFARILDPIEQFGVPRGWPDGLERRQDRPFSLESGSPPAYDAGSMIDEREMSVEVNGPSGFENA